MAIQKIFVDYDLNKNKILNAKMHPITTADRTAMASTLTTSDEGLMVYDVDTNTLYIWRGDIWLNVTSNVQDVVAGEALSSTNINGIVTLDVNTDNSTIEVVNDAIQVKTAKQTEWDTAYSSRILGVVDPMYFTNGYLGITQAGGGSSGYLWEGDYVNFNRAYNNSIVSGSVTGTTTKTLTLNRQYGTALQVSWTDDNTDAVLSVNGLTGAVVLNTDNIAEGAINQYFTAARARLALSAGAGISYDNVTGIISSTITQYTDTLARASISAGTGISYDSVSGVITNSAPDQTVNISSGAGINVVGTYPNFTIDSTITQYTDALARQAISLTTNGTAGQATYVNGVFNIPNYTTDLTGYATETYVNTQVSNLVGAAPTTLDTLNELAEALGDDPNFATSITTLIGTKEPAIIAGTTSQYWRGDKTWQTLPTYDLSGYVPYNGANQAVNLGAYDLTVNGLTIGRGAGSQASNTAIGNSALSNTSGVSNTAVGSNALLTATSYNTAVGHNALLNKFTGTRNVAIGYRAGFTDQSGTGNIFIGAEADVADYNVYSNCIVIGNSAVASQTNSTIIGNSSTVLSTIYGALKQTSVTSVMLKADGTGTLVGAIAGTDYLVPSSLTGYVPTSRTLTVNGITYDLSADRSWTISGTMPAGGTAGQILAKIDATNYNTTWIDNYAEKVQHTVKLGENMTIGTPVYVPIAQDAGTNMTVLKASNTSESTSSKTMGLIASSGVTNDFVQVITEGLLEGVNTGSATKGDPVWLGPDGTLVFGLTNKPYAPNHLVFIGIVTRAQTNNGEIFVKVQNGFEMDELHNVSAQNPNNNAILAYNTSTSLWEKNTITGVLGYIPYDSTNPAAYISGITSLMVTNALGYTPPSGSGTSNYITKWNSSSALTSSSIYDNGTQVTIGNTNGLRAFNIYSGTADNHLAIYGPAPSVSMSDAPIGTYQVKFGMATASGHYATGAVPGDFVIISQTGSVFFTTNGINALKLNSSGAGIFNNSVTAGSFIKSGATSSDFLMGDGSVSNNPGWLTSITSLMVTNALGFTPYNSTNPSGYITGISSTDVTTALGFTPYNSTNPSGYITTASLTWANISGKPTLLSQFTNDLGNYGGWITGITSGMVTTALGYTPISGSGSAGYLSRWTSSTALGNSVVYDNGSAIGINTSSPFESGAFKLDVNGGVIIKNTSGTTAQLILIDSNPATGGNNGFVQLTAGGNTGTAFGQWQTYYGTSIASGVLRLQPAGGNVLIGSSTAVTGGGMLQVAGDVNITGTFKINGTAISSGGVSSFNTRTGAVTLSSGDVTGALGFTPYNSTNPDGYITSSGSISGNAATATFSTSTSRLYSTDAAYNYTSANPYYGYLTYDGTYWLFKVSPASPDRVRVYIADNASSVAWTNVSGRPTSLSQFTNDLGNYGSWVTSSDTVAGLNTTFLGTGSTNISSGYSRVIRNENGSGGNPTYSPVLHLAASDTMWQISSTYGTSGDGTLYYRHGYAGSWGNWLTLITSSNISSQSVNYAGYSGYSNAVYLGGNSSYSITNSAWAGTSGYHGYTYTGGNFRFGFSSTSGVVDVYADGNFYATDSSYLVLHTGNISSYALAYASLSGSFGLNDNKLYLRTNGDNNHYLWNAGDDWEEMVAYSGTGFRVQSTNGYTIAAFSSGGQDNNMISIGPDSGGNNGLTLNSGDCSACYSRLRFRHGGTERQQIHIFSPSWQGGSLSGQSTGAINIAGYNGVTFGSWNSVAGWIDNAGNQWNRGYIEAYGDMYLGAGINGQVRLRTYNNRNLEVRGTGGGDVGITGINSSGSLGFQLYGDGSGSYGFLWGQWGGWRQRFTSDGSIFVGYIESNSAIRINSNNNLYLDYNYGQSIVGVYTSVRYQGVWAMGDAYKIAIDGTNSGNLYGLTWSHPNTGGQAGYLTNHGLIVMMYGTAFVTLSDNIWCRNNITAYSDIRVKENIEVIPNAMEKINAIRGVTFTRNDVENKTQRHAGVIAQEIQKVLPEVITVNKSNGHLSVAYGNIVGLTIEGLKEHDRIIVKQQETIDLLIAEIENLKQVINGITK